MSDDNAPRRDQRVHTMGSQPAVLAAIFGDARTDRLALRRVQPGDAPALFAIDGDPATHRHSPAGPAPNLADSDERLREWMRGWREYGFGYWAVSLASSQRIIGFGGVRHIVWRERDVLNLYYRFTPSAWGNGYAAETARMAVTLAREHLPYRPVVALVRPANIPSLRVAERVGLLRRLDLEDEEHVVLALGWDAR